MVLWLISSPILFSNLNVVTTKEPNLLLLPSNCKKTFLIAIYFKGKYCIEGKNGLHIFAYVFLICLMPLFFLINIPIEKNIWSPTHSLVLNWMPGFQSNPLVCYMMLILWSLSTNSLCMPYSCISFLDWLAVNCPQIFVMRWKKSCVRSIFFLHVLAALVWLRVLHPLA